MTLWLDCSSNYAIVPPPRKVQELATLGFDGAIVGSSWGHAKALQQLDAFRIGGLAIEEYQFPEQPQPLSGDGRWLDMETSTATLERVRPLLAEGTWRGPYSRSGWALDNLPGWDCKAEFPNAELWDARYVHGDNFDCLIKKAVDEGGDIAAAIAIERSWITAFRPYWGFTTARMTQWHNSIVIAGVNMDLNEREEDAMTPEERKEIDDLKAIVWGQAVKQNSQGAILWDHGLRLNAIEAKPDGK